MQHRLYVEKPQSNKLLNEFIKHLELKTLSSIRIINVYDIFNVSKPELDKIADRVFFDGDIDIVYFGLMPIQLNMYLVIEYLGYQYDKRADAAETLLKLFGIDGAVVKTATLYIFNDSLLPEELQLIKQYSINPIESREKNLHQLEIKHESRVSSKENILNFINFTNEELLALNFSLNIEDMQAIQKYFQIKQRNPSLLELKFLDTYWSDHCRHSTFNTHITVKFSDGEYKNIIETTYNEFVGLGYKTTLMNIATAHAKQNKHSNVEVSEENNACCLIQDVIVDGKPELWSIQFKNETHNHPTEIEPIGGAATCLGGAIRDTLAGRAYAYQAVRISGAGNPLEPVHQTLKGKLSQIYISKKSAEGFSSYGNQIGIATTLIKEIYHEGYKAKHLELGMIVAAVPYKNIVRKAPIVGDLVVLIGGQTGCDGCGGATGSSKSHTLDSKNSASEVQKANPIIERQIQRLFRNQAITKLIKRCNDCGAGGIALSVSEIADGITVYLDNIPVKYELTSIELALSESQERMILILDKDDFDVFQRLSSEENVIARVIGEVTDTNKFIIVHNDEILLELEREFLSTNGVIKTTTGIIQTTNPYLLYDNIEVEFELELKKHLSDINNASQGGLIEMFDSSVGKTTVLLPLGGKYQLTPQQSSVQKIPVLSGNTDTVTVVTFGTFPNISSISPFHAGYYAIVHAVAACVSVGGNYKSIKFSFQEYFPRLNSDEKWGDALSIMLGAYKGLSDFNLTAIGGKDSVSGSFENLDVPHTLVAFALSISDANNIISNELKNNANYKHLHVFIPAYDEHNLLTLSDIEVYHQIEELIINKDIVSAMAVESSVAVTLAKMSFGNKSGFHIDEGFDNAVLFKQQFGAIVFQSRIEKINCESIYHLGLIDNTSAISYKNTSINLDELIDVWQKPLSVVFPLPDQRETKNSINDKFDKLITTNKANKTILTKPLTKKPHVLIVCFPGTNNEYDMQKSFIDAGAEAEIYVFNNMSIIDIQTSLKTLAKKIHSAEIFVIPGGFSAGDEPDGSAKFIAIILQDEIIKSAIEKLLARDGLILGICNGFQALIKAGLLTNNLISDKIKIVSNSSETHVSKHVAVKIINNSSPWLSSFEIGETDILPISHGEGKIIISNTLFENLIENQQIATQYTDTDSLKSSNPNGAFYDVEALTSYNGKILGRMAHSDRTGNNLYKNVCHQSVKNIFINGVQYFYG